MAQLGKGSFYRSIHRNCLQYTGPSARSALLPPDQQHPDFWMYLQRFGAFGANPEYGLIAWSLAAMMQDVADRDLNRLADRLGLLMITVVQASMDSNFDLARLMLLEPEPPPEMLTRHHDPSNLRSTPMSADPQWSTVLAAYVSEMDTLASRRATLLGAKTASFGGVEPSAGIQSASLHADQSSDQKNI